MTRAEILALEGRDLDAAVAEHVMGLTVWEGASEADPVPRYSSDIAAAWQVVEEMARLGYRLEVEELTVATHPHCGVTDTILSFWRKNTDRVYNRYAYTGPVPVAICRAALLAVCGEGEA